METLKQTQYSFFFLYNNRIGNFIPLFLVKYKTLALHCFERPIFEVSTLFNTGKLNLISIESKINKTQYNSLINPFQSSVVFHTKASHLICCYIKWLVSALNTTLTHLRQMM